MGQSCGSPIKGMGCNFMGVLFLSQCLPGSGLCNRSVHQGQAAIWGVFLSPPASEAGMQIATALERWRGELLPRFGICSTSTFLFSVLFMLPPTPFVFQAASSAFLNSRSKSVFSVSLWAVAVYIFFFFVLCGPGGTRLLFLALPEVEFGLSYKHVSRWQ